MFITLLVLSTILIGLSVTGLAIKMLIIDNGRFPVTSVGGNIHLKKKGISCPKHEELRHYRSIKSGSPCVSCGYEV
ncbi:MAG: hypothetical protein QNK30_11765 [Bacteroidales bacterium]|nr:hypothetical protein [Bacteroidales bacterium]